MFSIASASALRRSIAETRRQCISYRRGLLTLAIETSCDDTSVAIVEKQNDRSTPKTTIHFLENITADSRAHKGIHPILALESHQESLANLVNKAMKSLPAPTTNTNGQAQAQAQAQTQGQEQGNGCAQQTINLADGSTRRRPDFISATRGPGMRSNLSVGLDTGKALSVAWQIPFIGVHHMQAHLLTPRLVSSLEAETEAQDTTTTTTTTSKSPAFPFLSILVSGGHSILVHSKSTVNHQILASSSDIAIGEALDKGAREILPDDILNAAKTTMYGKALEQFVFGDATSFPEYIPPQGRGQEVIKRTSEWGWSLTTPFANTRDLKLSFSSIASMVGKIVQARLDAGGMSREERVELGREAMRVCFEHLASRTVIALEKLRLSHVGEERVKTLVVSGGVAANRFLMAVLRSFLDVRGFEDVVIVAPPPYLCTDNAAMIAWAGIEMFEEGWRTGLSVRALRKWSLDPEAEDGGVLGPSGWTREE